jgi:hypothetical protein
MKFWTLIQTQGKQRDYIEFETLDQLNRALKKHGFQIEYTEVNEKIKESNL